jgi:hypothetical protein
MFKAGDEITDRIHAGIEARRQRGMEIVALARDRQDGWFPFFAILTHRLIGRSLPRKFLSETSSRRYSFSTPA